MARRRAPHAPRHVACRPVADYPDDILGVSAEPLDIAALERSVRDPRAGAVVVFVGTVRDHSEGRDGVVGLRYEAYAEPANRRLAELVRQARSTWPDLCRVAVVHRVGDLDVGDDAVLVAASAPHRGDAFAAAEWLIDEAKATLPVWKHETWADGADFGVDAAPIVSVGSEGR